MYYSDSEIIIAEDGSIEDETSLTRLNSCHEQSSAEPTAIEDLSYIRKIGKMEHAEYFSALLMRLNLTCGVINRHTNQIYRLSFRVGELEKDNLYTSNLSRNVTNEVHALEIRINEMRKTIKKLHDKINSLTRARDETLEYVNKRVDRVRKLRKYGYHITRERQIRVEVTIDGDYKGESILILTERRAGQSTTNSHII